MMKQRQKRDSSMKPEGHGVLKRTNAGQRECGPNYAKGLVLLLGVPAWLHSSRLLRIAPKLYSATAQARTVSKMAAT